MGLPRITYNSKTIDIPFAPKLLDVLTATVGTRTKSVLGAVETNIFRTDVRVKTVWENVKITDQPDLYRQLRQWAEWAMAGNSWIYTNDRTKTAVSTLATCAQGSAAPTKTSGTDPAAGDTCVIRHPLAREVVKVNSVVGSTYNLAETINSDVFALAIAAGDIVKCFPEYYWNGRLTQPDNPIHEDKLWFRLDMTFDEDVNAFLS